jgi:tetratricopeptide (TPR) repeat protein
VAQHEQLTVQQAISKAKKAIKKGNTAEALELYTAVLKHQPHHSFVKKELRKLQKGLSKNQSIKAESLDPPQDQITALVNLYKSDHVLEAEQTCRELLKTCPQSLGVINILGEVLRSQGKLEEALQIYESAIQLGPSLAEIYNNHGNVLKELGRFGDALESYDKAIQVNPDFAMAYYNRAGALLKIRQLDEALRSYDKAIQVNPDYADAYYNRGNLLRELGQLDEALQSYDKAIQFKPDFVNAYYNRGIVITKYKANDPQIGFMEGLYSQPELKKSDRQKLSFALAKGYEDLGEYGKSFSYLERGNLLCKKGQDYNIASDRKLFSKIKDLFEAGSLALAVAPGRDTTIQPLFIVGMPRSGTTLIEQILASHSKVHGAGELVTLNELASPIVWSFTVQETSQNRRGISQEEIKAVRNTYLKSLAALKVPEKVITDKMPLNFRWVGFILSAFPEAKIVHVNRNSVATCWSIYKQLFRSDGNEYAYDMDDLIEYYKLYIDLMSFWREKFPNRIYDLCYESLTENQEEETRELLEFCGLEWEEKCLDFHKTKRVVTTASAAQVREEMYTGSSEAWRKYENHLQPLVKALHR